MRTLTARVGPAAILAIALALTACGNSKVQDGDTAVSTQDGEADSGLTDAVANVDAASDGQTTDDGGDASQPSDGSSDSAVDVDINGSCPGGANCPCKGNTDCDNNICLEVADGQRCAIQCGGGSCPGGFTCTAFTQGGGDAQYVCVQNWGRICEPCDNSKLCSAALGNEKSVCIAYGGLEGSFCGALCAVDGDCPGGYGCKDVTSIEGKAAKQCARLPDGGGHIQCPCDGNATAQKLSTTCNAAVVTGGSCPGTRTCGSAGLGACTASPAAGELCDGVDNDCNGLTDDVVCDDKNPCTDDACKPADQTCVHPANAQLCSDGNACTSNDACSGGLCVGKAVDCDDQNACTSDSCDPKTGCQNVNAAIPCDDGNACTLGDTCIDGTCVVGKKKDCDDKNACTSDGCNTTSGLCGHGNLTGSACTDGDFCTSNDACAGGKCVGTQVSCDDNNACTSDGCDMAIGCTNTALATGCDDGNPCTVGDKCLDAVCISGSQKACNDQNNCTSDGCDTITGNCVNKPLNGAACNDGNACTEPDACTDTACTGKTKNCDDSNSCTADSCDTATGCTHTGLTGSCEDGNACTLGDVCSNNFCISGTPKGCDDNNPCTGDSCDTASGECLHTALPGQACTDGNACTGPDVCGGGSAGPTGCGGPGKSCDDSNLCTDDSCDTTSGCTHVGNAKPCDDGNACTSGDACISLLGGICYGNPIVVATVCDDGNPCTSDTCDQTKGCTYTPKVNVQCDDGNDCTQGDSCNIKGVCVSGTNSCQCTADTDCVQPTNKCIGTLYCNKAKAPYYCTVKAGTIVTCDTSNDGACKSTSCDSATGQCAATPFDGKPCDADGSVCTVSDTCAGGVCAAGTSQNCDDGNPCTVDSCDATKGCMHSANAIACSDGNACTLNDVCASGSCQPGAGKVCNDGQYCTSDSCNPNSGDCVFYGAAFENAACDDGSVCTVGDLCKSGACAPGGAKDCSDNNVCTDDACDAAIGCKHTYNVSGCSDGNACTTGDVCNNGQCSPGQLPNCDDANTCTADSCNTQTGVCIHNPTSEGLSCNADNSVCTLNDTCKSGSCTADIPTNCADSNVCTDDNCDPVTGCAHPYNNAACSDNNACTANDVCQNGSCKSGTLVNCDDNNPCTTDACDGVGGCSHPNIDQTTASGCDGSTGKWCLTGVCKTKGCGDGFLDSGEQCDDGNASGCDGCESCQTRSAVQFSGAGASDSGFGTFAGASPYLAVDGDMTIEAWVNPANLTTAQPIAAHAGSVASFLTTYELELEQTTGKIVFQHGPSATSGSESVKSSSTVKTGAWSHVAVVIAGQNVRFYLNGQTAGTATLSMKRQSSTVASFVVGRRTPDYKTLGFNGAIDELHVAAAPLYGANFSPPRRVSITAATRGLWHFDEASGAMAADAAATTQKPLYPLTLSGNTWLADACYGAAKNAGVCGDGQIASANGSFPGTEECEPTSSNGCGVCQDCKYRRELTLGGTSALVTPIFSSWASDAFCPTCSTTIEMWAKADFLDTSSNPGTYTPSTLFATTCPSGSVGSNGFFVFIDPGLPTPGVVRVQRVGAINNGQAFATSTVIKVGDWHHYALEMSWANFGLTRLYIDGSLALEIKPSQWDTVNGNTGFTMTNLFTSETLMIGAYPIDDLLNPVSLVDSAIAPNQLVSALNWTGEMDEIRVSAGIRYGTSFVPARRAYPDANTRALWHMDGATSTLADDSGAAITTLNTAPTLNDDCYGAPANSAKCGDGVRAPWEWDDGAASPAANFPVSIAAVGLTCTPYWNFDCSGFSWQATDTNAPALTNAVINYPTLTLPGGATIAAPWTWEGWVRLPFLPASGKTGTIAAMDSSLTGGACAQSQTQAWAIQTLSDGTDASTLGGTGTSSAAKQVWKAGVWQHFALEYHGDSTGSLWVDGQKVRTFNVNATSWNGSCKMHFGSREGGAGQTNRISGAMASLHMARFVKYGAAFDPSWSLPIDGSNTMFFWDFANGKACPLPNTDFCAQGVDNNNAVVSNAYIDLGSATASGSGVSSGPMCTTQPTP
jgi:hypothetical protein